MPQAPSEQRLIPPLLSRGLDTSSEIVPTSQNYNLFGTFLQDEIKLTDSLSLTAGAKLEHNAFSGFGYEPECAACVEQYQPFDYLGCCLTGTSTTINPGNSSPPSNLPDCFGTALLCRYNTLWQERVC